MKLLRDAIAVLDAAGIATPRVDAELLLAHVLGIDRGALVTVRDVSPSAAARFDALLARRAAREPLQYLTGEAPFRFALIRVGPGVFIPRPETELLVDAVLPVLRAASAPVAVDLCAGSGALAVAIAQEVAGARVVAVERSPSALAWLRRNAQGSAIEIVPADIAQPGLLAELAGRVDAVVSNPPYVASSTVVGAEVAHDPAEAVFAGPDGLEVIPSVISAAAALLRPGGILAFEHDDTQGETAVELLRASTEWTDVAGHFDLTGRPRYATATRTATQGTITA
jgi:release factor glutamine methyltransferase